MYISSSVSDVLTAAKVICTGQNDIATLFFADTDVRDIEVLRRGLTAEGIRFMGGIAPYLIVGTAIRDCGALIRRHSCAGGLFVIPDPVSADITPGIVQDLEQVLSDDLLPVQLEGFSHSEK